MRFPTSQGLLTAPGMLRLGLMLVLVPCLASIPLTAQEIEPLLQPRQEIPEEQLLDVGIELFSTNLPPGLEDWQMKEQGIYPEVRRAEARYLPVRLMHTLQASGQWGAVRVVPPRVDAVDLQLEGLLVESSGHELAFELTARDATGRVWLDRKYKAEADPRAYHHDENDPVLVQEPFTALYHEIANDLVRKRDQLKPEHLREIRRVARLRFASDLVPDAFGEHLGQGWRGRLHVESLPAEGDPLLERVRRVRQRDLLFIDTLSEHYATFAARMEEPYDSWRRFAWQEEEAERKIRRKARTRKILGALAVLGGVLAAPDSRAEAAARDAAILGGAMVIQSGVAQSKQAEIHTEALKELASSFDAEVEPILLEVEGETLRLTGSVETQFETWREILHRMFLEDRGLTLDPDTGQPVPGAPTASRTFAGDSGDEEIGAVDEATPRDSTTDPEVPGP